MKRSVNWKALVVIVTFSAAAAYVGVRGAAAQSGTGQKAAAEQLLRDFAAAIEKNDLPAAQKLFATEADFKDLFPAGDVKTSVANIQSRSKLAFPEFVAALKEFGKHDLYEVNPGTALTIPKGQRGNSSELRLYDSASISFAKDANSMIELRIRIGGIIQGATGRWAITNITTRQEFFGAKGGG